MSNAPEPDRSAGESGSEPAGERSADPGEERTESYPLVPHDAETETVVITTSDNDAAVTQPEAQRERRFTAPGFDAKETQVIVTAHEAATEVFQTNQAPTTPPRMPTGMPPKTAVPQSIPPRTEATSVRQRTWGWALAVVVIVLALAAIAILGTVLLTRGKHSKMSQEDQVRQAIQSLDIAIQTGDLTALRSLTCGSTAMATWIMTSVIGPKPIAGFRRPNNIRSSPASTRSSSTARTPRPMSPLSWRSIPRSARPAASTYSFATISGRSASPPATEARIGWFARILAIGQC